MNDDEELDEPFIRAIAVPSPSGEIFEVFIAWDAWDEICTTCESCLVQMVLAAQTQPDFSGQIHFLVAEEFVPVPDLPQRMRRLEQRLAKKVDGKRSISGQPLAVSVRAATSRNE